jgi:hypothetical protein
MPELMEVIESIQADAASVQRIFGDAGRSVRSMTGKNNPEFMRNLVEVAKIVADARRGTPRGEYLLREAMTTSDFPLYFGDIIDRTVLARYQALTPYYPNYTQGRSVKDFRTANIFAFDGAEGQLDVVPEQTEYPAAALSETRYQVSVLKHGRRLPFSWEALINDDFNILDDIPSRFANACRRSEEKDVAKLICDANGPHAAFYTAGNKNQIIIANGSALANPVLSIAGIQAGLVVLAKQLDLDGEPIFFDSLELVVPLSLRPTADQIIRTLEYRTVDTGAVLQVPSTNATPMRVIAGNGIANSLRVSSNPYLATIPTANGNTSWYLFASPSAGARSALIFAKLRGHEDPETFVKEPNARRVGGGGINPMDADFMTDSIEYKVRHTWGTARADPKTTVASNGTGV